MRARSQQRRAERAASPVEPKFSQDENDSVQHIEISTLSLQSEPNPQQADSGVKEAVSAEAQPSEIHDNEDVPDKEEKIEQKPAETAPQDTHVQEDVTVESLNVQEPVPPVKQPEKKAPKPLKPTRRAPSSFATVISANRSTSASNFTQFLAEQLTQTKAKNTYPSIFPKLQEQVHDELKQC